MRHTEAQHFQVDRYAIGIPSLAFFTARRLFLKRRGTTTLQDALYQRAPRPRGVLSLSFLITSNQLPHGRFLYQVVRFPREGTLLLGKVLYQRTPRPGGEDHILKLSIEAPSVFRPRNASPPSPAEARVRIISWTFLFDCLDTALARAGHD
jgi:hypothetical protein